MGNIFDSGTIRSRHGDRPWWQIVRREARWWWEVWNPHGAIRRLYWFYQRGRRGWSDCDAWGFNGYLAGVIAGGCTYLVGGSGYPGGGDADTYEKWQAILKEIAEGFSIIARDEDVYEDGRITVISSNRPEYKRAMNLFAEWFPALWD